MTTGPLNKYLPSSKPSGLNGVTAAQPVEPNGITKPETETDANHGGRLEETSSKRSSQTDRSSDSALSRNDSNGKCLLDDTTVTSNVSAQLKSSASASHNSWRSRLQMNDDWHSEVSSVQRMLDYLRLEKSGSLQSAKTHCVYVDRFCRETGMTASSLVLLPRNEVESLVRQHCNKVMERSRLRGPSARSANTALACLKTFFACNGFNKGNNSDLRLRNYPQPPRTYNRLEHIPSLKEALAMADRCGSKRDRAIILTAISTGLRNSALRALNVGDLLEQLKKGEKILVIDVEANLNQRIPGACKNNVPYFTFTSKIATEAIESMLKEREGIFGSYSSDDPLFISNYNQLEVSERATKRLTMRQLQVIVHNAAQAADIQKWRQVCVHSLRKVFDSVLRLPLEDGNSMDTKDQEFLMGHLLPGSQDHYYDRSKVEKLREIYAKLVFEDKPAAQVLSLETTRRLARVLGLNPFEVKAIREKEVGKPLSYQEEEELLEKEIKGVFERQNQEEQKIIQLAELDQQIASGWKFINTLPDGRVVIGRARASLGRSPNE